MNRSDLFKELNNGVLRKIYFFYGHEQYIINSAIEKIKTILKNTVADDIDCICVEGASVSGDEIVELCSSVSFISSQKLIIVDDFPSIINKDSKADESILSYIEDPYDDILIFKCSSDPVKTSAIYKKLQSNACAVEFSALSESELQSFISKELKKYDKCITNDALLFLIQYADTELNMLSNEINKLALCVDEKTITIEHIEQAVTPSREYKIFKLTDYILECNTKEAIALIDLLLIQKEEAFFILAVIAKTFHNCLLIFSMKNDAKTSAEICKTLGIKDFALNKLQRYCAKLSKSSIEKCNEILLLADSEIKSSAASDKVCLTKLVMSLINTIKK